MPVTRLEPRQRVISRPCAGERERPTRCDLGLRTEVCTAIFRPQVVVICLEYSLALVEDPGIPFVKTVIQFPKHIEGQNLGHDCSFAAFDFIIRKLPPSLDAS